MEPWAALAGYRDADAAAATAAWRRHMYLSNQSLLVIILVGIIAGWLAGRLVAGGGFGLIGDLVLGVIGAFIGEWLLPRLNIHLGVGTVALIINATLGAIVLLFILRLLSGGFGRRPWRCAGATCRRSCPISSASGAHRRPTRCVPRRRRCARWSRRRCR